MTWGEFKYLVFCIFRILYCIFHYIINLQVSMLTLSVHDRSWVRSEIGANRRP